MRRVLIVVATLIAAQVCSAQSALFSAEEKIRLIRLTQEDAEAKAVFAKLRAEADAALKRAPNPIREIHTEGRLAGDPDKVATQTALKDMPALAALGYAYFVLDDANYADKAREFILAWAGKNHPTGDPIDETNLEPLIVAYDLTRQTFSDHEREKADAYLRKIIKAEWSDKQRTNNWQSHRIKIVGLSAFVLNDDKLVEKTIKGFKEQIADNLQPDGSSFDFHERDALHYHVYDLEPLLTLAIAAHTHGMNLYDYTSRRGASLRKSVHFLIPYCTGEEQHEEYVHSKVKFDYQRAANGEENFRIGRLFRPKEGFKTLSLAAYFDDAVEPVIAKLKDQNQDLMDSWRLVLNEAARAKPTPQADSSNVLP